MLYYYFSIGFVEVDFSAEICVGWEGQFKINF